MTRLLSPISLVILALILAGCAGNGSNPITAPSPFDTSGASITGLTGATVSDSSDRYLWGYWQCELDRDTLELNAIPCRTAMVHVNVVGPLNNSLGMSVTVDKVLSQPANGLFVLTVGLTHPYAGNNKLTGFDVRGIMITTAELLAGTLPLPGANDPVILNADGYTRWWNPTEFPTPGLLGYTPGIYGKDPPPATPLVSGINPYKQFADGLYIDHPVTFLTLLPPTSSNGRGVFRSGVTNKRLYQIQFPVMGTPKVFFNYAVDASWAPASTEPIIIPSSFPMTANAPEAFIMEADVDASTLWATGGPDCGGVVDLTVKCWDWQGWVGDYSGEIGPLTLISPYCMFEEGVEPNVTENPDGSVTLTASVTGSPTSWGEIPVWVGVTAPGSNYKQGLEPAPDLAVAAYYPVTVHVEQAECEVNNTYDCNTALQIAAVDLKTGMLCLDVDETDWYSFTVLNDGSANGTILLTPYGTGNLDLILYRNCPPSIVDYSTNPGNADEAIDVSALGPDDYYIEVHYEDAGPGPIPYALSTDLTGMGEDCTVDNNNSKNDAELIGMTGSDSDTVCLVGDPADWYTLVIDDASTAYGTIDLDNSDFANNDIEIFKGTGTSPLYAGNNPGTQDEHLDVILEGGTYYIKIFAEDSTPTGDRNFSLILDIEEFVGDCDDADGNNTPLEAVQLSYFQTESGTVCFPSDQDWYKFTAMPPGVDGTITLSSGNLYDNDLTLYRDPSDPPIDQSTNSGTGDEVLEVSGLTTGTYYLEVTTGLVSPGVNQEFSISTDLTEATAVPTDFRLHVYIVRTTQGDNPAASEQTVEDHSDWADQFYGTWTQGSVTISEISYIDKTGWLSLTVSEAEEMFAQYGDECGALHVFYVNDFPDMPGAAAYTFMDCEFQLQDHTTSFVAMSDYCDDATLAHEMGHGIGLLGDMYLLDFYTCEDITWCPSGPSDIFCLEADADYGNIMYWPIGTNINDYWMSDTDIDMSTPEIESQAENIVHFNVNYPNAFY